MEAECLIIKLNTPGGLLKSTRVIVTAILDSPVPVVVYVYPGGSQAASAGVFVTLAAHVAAMAPGTNIGAAHPVSMQGQQDSIMNEKPQMMQRRSSGQ
jgi:membrane-bound serine protease (ClpP class)